MILDSSTGYSKQITIPPVTETNNSNQEKDDWPSCASLKMGKPWAIKGTSVVATLLFTRMTSQVLANHPSGFVLPAGSHTSISAGFDSEPSFWTTSEMAMENQFMLFLDEQINADDSLVVPADIEQLQRIADLIDGVEVD